jgi:host factor-I protein
MLLLNPETSCKHSPYNLFMATKKRHKGPPAGETGQEALYLKSLSDRQVPVTIKLRDGEMVSGWVEYFDDMMLRLTREGKPNLFIYKAQIRTITEGGASGLRRSVLNEEGAGL